MCFSSPNIPAATPPPAAAKDQDPSIKAALDADRQRRDAMGGSKSTILTSAAGLTTPATSAPKTLLGS